MNKLNSKEELVNRFAAFKRFNEWEKKNPVSMDACGALAAVGAIYDLMPEKSRNYSPDSCGIKSMQSALSHIRGCR